MFSFLDSLPRDSRVQNRRSVSIKSDLKRRITLAAVQRCELNDESIPKLFREKAASRYIYVYTVSLLHTQLSISLLSVSDAMGKWNNRPFSTNQANSSDGGWGKRQSRSLA